MTINVTNFSPAPGATIAQGATLTFDVTFSPPENPVTHYIVLTFGNSSGLAWDGEGFPIPYASSSRVAISGGYRYTIRQNGSWPGGRVPVVAVRTIDPSPVQTDFAERLAFDSSKRMVFSGDGSETCVLSIDPDATPVDGTMIEVFIPAGEAGDLSLAPAFMGGGHDEFDPDEPMMFRALYTGEAYETTLRVLTEPSAAAPTIVSLTVSESDPDKLGAVFSTRMHFVDLTGLSLDFAVGTARTITGLDSGNGTDTLTFDLSGDVEDGDELDLVIGSSRTLASMDGVLIAAGTTAVDVNLAFVMAGEVHVYRADSRTMGAGSDIDSLVDLGSGATNATASATKPQLATLGGQDAFTLAGNAYFKADRGSNLDVASGAIFFVGKTANVDAVYETLVGLGRHDDLTTLVGVLYDFNGASGMAGQRNGGSSEVTGTGIGNAIHAVLFTWDTAGAKLYIDGVETGTVTAAATNQNIRRISIGITPGLSTLPAPDVTCCEVRVGTQKLTGGDITALFDYAQDRYGTP